MIPLGDGFAPTSVLAIGAHSDDIEIGALGLILRLRERQPALAVDWIVLAAGDERANEARASVKRLGGDKWSVQVFEHEQRYFPYLADLKHRFDQLGTTLDPDLILCPWAGDAHQDHRTVANLVRETFRSHLRLEYEILKTDGDLGRPNLYVDLPEGLAERKIDHLLESFPSQAKRSWFTDSAFRGLMRVRGVESGAESGYAEAFFCQKAKLLT